MSSDKTRWRSKTRFTRAEDTLGFLLWQVTHAWQRALDAALIEYGMTHLQLVLLADLAKLLESSEEVTQVQLARFCDFEVTLVSQVLRKLEVKGAIARFPAQSDPRAKQLIVTPIGEETLVTLMPILERTHDAFFAGLKLDRNLLAQELVRLWKAHSHQESKRD